MSLQKYSPSFVNPFTLPSALSKLVYQHMHRAGHRGIGRVPPGLSKFHAQTVRTTNAVRTGQIAPAGMAAALRGTRRSQSAKAR